MTIKNPALKGASDILLPAIPPLNHRGTSWHQSYWSIRSATALAGIRLYWGGNPLRNTQRSLFVCVCMCVCASIYWSREAKRFCLQESIWNMSVWCWNVQYGGLANEQKVNLYICIRIYIYIYKIVQTIVRPIWVGVVISLHDFVPMCSWSLCGKLGDCLFAWQQLRCNPL